MKLTIILPDFTPVISATERKLDDTPIIRAVVGKPLEDTIIFEGAASKNLRTALADALYRITGIEIIENEIEMRIGEGSDTSTYLVKRPLENC